MIFNYHNNLQLELQNKNNLMDKLNQAKINSTQYQSGWSMNNPLTFFCIIQKDYALEITLKFVIIATMDYKEWL